MEENTILALPSSFSVTQAGVNELWRAGLPRMIEGWPAPLAPEFSVVAELLRQKALLQASTGLASALAAVVTDSGQLDTLLSFCKKDEVRQAAATNPALSNSARGTMPFSKMGTTAGDTAPEVVVTQLIFDGEVDGLVAAFSTASLKEAVMKQLLALSGVVKLGSGAKGPSVYGKVYPEATTIVVDDNACDPWTIRRFRGAVLGKLAQSNHEMFVEFGASVAKERLIDPYVVPAIAAALTAGAVTHGELGQLSGFSASVVELHYATAFANVEAENVVPAVAHKKSQPAPAAYSHNDPYLEALELLGMGDAAANLAISAGVSADSEFDRWLPQANVTTIVDWAERRLGTIPRPGQVAEVLDSLSAVRQVEVMAEVKRRPNPIALQPELALCLSGASTLKVNDRAAVFVGITASRAFGDNSSAWALAATLLTQGWEHSLLELFRTVESLSA